MTSLGNNLTESLMGDHPFSNDSSKNGLIQIQRLGRLGRLGRLFNNKSKTKTKKTQRAIIELRMENINTLAERLMNLDQINKALEISVYDNPVEDSMKDLMDILIEKRIILNYELSDRSSWNPLARGSGGFIQKNKVTYAYFEADDKNDILFTGFTDLCKEIEDLTFKIISRLNPLNPQIILDLKEEIQFYKVIYKNFLQFYTNYETESVMMTSNDAIDPLTIEITNIRDNIWTIQKQLAELGNEELQIGGIKQRRLITPNHKYYMKAFRNYSKKKRKLNTVRKKNKYKKTKRRKH